MTALELKAQRKRLGLTQHKLAAALGVSQVTVALWETGTMPINRRTEMAVEHLECCQHLDFTENQDGDRRCRQCGLTTTN